MAAGGHFLAAIVDIWYLVFFFFYFFRLMILGYKKDLVESDIWDLNPREKSSTLVPPFEKYWFEEVERCMSKGYVFYMLMQL